jgi:hypothetical protein
MVEHVMLVRYFIKLCSRVACFGGDCEVQVKSRQFSLWSFIPMGNKRNPDREKKKKKKERKEKEKGRQESKQPSRPIRY